MPGACSKYGGEGRGLHEYWRSWNSLISFLIGGKEELQNIY
jgi:hypothetical protein